MTKLTTKQLRKALDNAMEDIRERSHDRTFRHYKGGIYKVEGVVWLTEGEVVGVVYFRIDGPGYDRCANEKEIKFVRPFAEFTGTVSLRVRGAPKRQPRFAPAVKVERWEARIA